MTLRRRASGPRRALPGVLLLAAGVLLAVGAPVIWSATHQDPALQAIDPGVAVRLAQAEISSPASVPSTLPGTTSVTTEPTAGSLPTTTSPRVTTPGTARPTTGGPGSTKAGATGPGATGPGATKPGATKPSATKPPTATKPPVSTTSVTPPSLGVPTRLRIPAIGVDAPVEAVGVDDKGEMAIPEQVQQIGWYKFGPAPGASTGSIVMSGHIDSRVQGLGAFHDLGDLQAGDLVTVEDDSGRALTYRVVGKEAFDKKTVPLDDLFSRTGAARLTLITCGGGFDAQAHSYLDNIVVTAVPQ